MMNILHVCGIFHSSTDDQDYTPRIFCLKFVQKGFGCGCAFLAIPLRTAILLGCAIDNGLPVI